MDLDGKFIQFFQLGGLSHLRKKLLKVQLRRIYEEDEKFQEGDFYTYMCIIREKETFHFLAH